MSYLFKNNWQVYDENFTSLTKEIKYKVDLPVEFFENLKFDPQSLKEYRIAAAQTAASLCGDNPVLCLSGGIDSQAMVQCWQEANLKFDVAILVFNNNLNDHDVSVALRYCEQHNIKPIIYELDVIKFLTRESPDYQEKYKCSSPQFATHYKFFDWLREQYSGICCGGTALAPGKTNWGPGLSAAQINFTEYAKINDYPVVGNFLGYDPALSWSIAVLTPKHEYDWNWLVDVNLRLEDVSRYQLKAIGYRRHGFDIMLQEDKFTGFEKAKTYFKELTGDGWAFEKRFRLPWQQKFGSAVGELVLTTEQRNVLDELNLKHSISD